MELKLFVSYEIVFLILLGLLGTYFVYRAANTEFLGEDEALYLTAAQKWSHGEWLTKNEWGVIRSPPILIPFVIGIAFAVFGYSIAIAKTIVMLFGIATLFAVYLVGREFNPKVGVFAVFVLLCVYIFSYYGLLVYVDVPLSFFSALILLFVVKLNKHREMKYAIALGILLMLINLVKFDGWFLLICTSLFAFVNLVFYKDKELFKLLLLPIIMGFGFLFVIFVRDMYVFGYPHSIFGAEFFFPTQEMKILENDPHPYWKSMITINPELNQPIDYQINIGIVALLFMCVGSIYALLDRDKILLFAFGVFALFVVMLGLFLGEDRYLLLVLPEAAIMGGAFLSKLSESKKYLFAFMVVLLGLYAVYATTSQVTKISKLQRFDTTFITALLWLKNNTVPDSRIWANYCGATNHYAQRPCYFLLKPEFPYLMETDNSTFIYDVIKNKYSFSYVFIDYGMLGQGKTFFVPYRNLVGVFSQNAVFLMTNDTEHFEKVYNDGQRFEILHIKDLNTSAS